MASDIVFDNGVLMSHCAYKKGYGCKLNDVSIRDYKIGGFNNKILCIDLDRYERAISPHSINNTMDAAIGISNMQNQRRTSQRLMLVELRLDYKSAKNLSGTDLRRKSVHSRELLGMETSIAPNDYFIFANGIIEESRRKVNNLAIENGYKDKWCCQTIEEFNNFIKDAEDLPYIPINNENKIKGEIKSYGNDINSLLNIHSKWLQEARTYKDRYNYNETDVVCNAAIDALRDILSQYQSDDEESVWYIEDMISEYRGVINSIKK